MRSKAILARVVDVAIAQSMLEELTAQGVEVLFGAEAESVNLTDDGQRVTIAMKASGHTRLSFFHS